MYFHQPGVVHTLTIVFTAAYIVIPQHFCMDDTVCTSISPSAWCCRSRLLYHCFSYCNTVIPQQFCLADGVPFRLVLLLFIPNLNEIRPANTRTCDRPSTLSRLGSCIRLRQLGERRDTEIQERGYKGGQIEIQIQERGYKGGELQERGYKVS